MFTKYYRLFLLIFVAFTSLISQAQHKPAPVIPEFSFQTMDGKLFSRKNLPNNRKIVFVLFDVGCDHCQREVQDIGRRYADFSQSSLYLVSSDSKPAIGKFISLYGKQLTGKNNVTVLHDWKPEFIAKFRPDKYPATYVYSSAGYLVKYFSGQKDINEIVAAVK